MKNKTEQNVKEKKASKQKYIIAAICFIFLLLVALVFASINQESKPDPESGIIIRNTIARQLPRENNIEKDPNDLTDEDFAKVTTLSIIPTMGSGGVFDWFKMPGEIPLSELKAGELSDIKFIKKLPKLESLTLRSIRLPQKDIPNWMSLLAKLGIYDLEEKQSLDLSPLKSLSNLNYLSLQRTYATNIKPLARLVNLKTLDLSDMGLSNLEPLRSLVNLEYLDLSVNVQPYKFPETKIKNLEPIKALVALKVLNIRGTKVSNLEPVSGLTNLQELWVENTSVTNLEPVSQLVNLKMLLLNGDQITDLKPLHGLINLDILSLYYTPVTDLEPLKDLTNLRLLDIGCTNVTNLDSLKDLKNLESLFIEGCDNIPDEQIEGLQKALPSLSIIKDRGLDF